MIKKILKVNAASRATIGPIGITPLELSIDYQHFEHNFVVCTKLKQHLILGLDFTQRYRIRLDWDIYGKLFLQHEVKIIAISIKTNNIEQCTIASLEILAGKQNETDQKLHLITSNTITMPPYQSSIAPLKAIKQVINNNFKLDDLIEIEVNPFLTMEQPELILTPMLQ